MEGLYTLAGLRVGQADSRNTVLHGYSICTWISAEVVIKGPIFLNQEDDVINLLQSCGGGLRRAGRDSCHTDKQKDASDNSLNSHTLPKLGVRSFAQRRAVPTVTKIQFHHA